MNKWILKILQVNKNIINILIILKALWLILKTKNLKQWEQLKVLNLNKKKMIQTLTRLKHKYLIILKIVRLKAKMQIN